MCKVERVALEYVCRCDVVLKWQESSRKDLALVKAIPSHDQTTRVAVQPSIVLYNNPYRLRFEPLSILR